MEKKDDKKENSSGVLLDIMKLVGPFILVIIIYYVFIA